MDNVQQLDRYDYEAWQNHVLDSLKGEYHLTEEDAIYVLRHQKVLVNKLFDDFTSGKSKSLTEQLALLMDNDLENDCYI